MTVLLVFGLGVSRVIVNEVAVETDFMQRTKAFYAAEGGLEAGLFFHEIRLPGYEESTEFIDLNGAQYLYEIDASDTHFPCFEPDGYRALEPTESLSIPMFKDKSNDELDREEITGFVLEYYVDRSDSAFSDRIKGDVLRWKIIGFNDQLKTDSMSGVEQLEVNSEDSPVKFISSTDGSSFTYDSIAGQVVTSKFFSATDFLKTHNTSLLILTNIVNLPLQDDRSSENNRLMVRLTPDKEGDEFVCESSQIRASGRSGDAFMSLSSVIKEGSSLPILDFALYRTKTR